MLASIFLLHWPPFCFQWESRRKVTWTVTRTTADHNAWWHREQACWSRYGGRTILTFKNNWNVRLQRRLYSSGYIQIIVFQTVSYIQFQARWKQYRVNPTKIGSSAKGVGTLGGCGGTCSPRGKFWNLASLKFQILAHSQRELTRKLTETYGENCMC